MATILCAALVAITNAEAFAAAIQASSGKFSMHFPSSALTAPPPPPHTHTNAGQGHGQGGEQHDIMGKPKVIRRSRNHWKI